MADEDYGLLKSRRWNAEWIWTEGDGTEENAFCYFRTEFALSDPPAGSRVFITADTRYELYVNGDFVGRGVPPTQPYLQYYDQHELTDYLCDGHNCIAVLVNHLGTWPDARGGLLAEVTGADGDTLVATGPNWSTLRSRAHAGGTYRFRMNLVTPFQEHYDACKAPKGWTEPGFDDADWQSATTLGRPPHAGPWSRLLPRDIPHMTSDPVLPRRVERVEEALNIMTRSRSGDLSVGLSAPGKPLEYARVEGAESLCSEGGETVVQCSTAHQDGSLDGIYDPCIVLDFGKVLTGRPRIRLDGVEGGVVDIGYAERLIDGRFNNALEGQFADRCYMTDGPLTYRPFTWKAFRYLKLRFRSCPEPVKVKSVEAVVSTYPYEERGDFRSEDKELDAVFEMSRRTIRLCSNEFLMDTPWREQAQWLGDVSAVTLGGIYACFGDAEMPAKFLRQTAANQCPTGLLHNVSNRVDHSWHWTIFDYSLWWLMGLWNHYLYTGDESWIHRLYPTASRILQCGLLYVNEVGLLEDVPYWIFIDWADVETDGECAALNAIWYGALQAVRKMAEVKGDDYTATLCEEHMTGIEEVFQNRFFDPERGCFADARIEGELSPKTSEHANVAALLWGLCDDDTAAGIVERLYEDQSVRYTEAQPFFTSVALRALDRLGRFDLALKLVRQRWGRRFVDRGFTSTPEEWTINGTWRDGCFKPIMRTLSHAWSAFPAEFLIKHLAGVEILEPGCRRVQVKPQGTDFDYTVVYPTPHGPVQILHKDGQFEFSAPDGVELIT